MNNKSLKIERQPQNVSWVCCPECGTRHIKSILACDICRCAKCNTDFRAYVARGAVIVIPFSPEEDELDTFTRIIEYIKQLVFLAKAQ